MSGWILIISVLLAREDKTPPDGNNELVLNFSFAYLEKIIACQAMNAIAMPMPVKRHTLLAFY